MTDITNPELHKLPEVTELAAETIGTNKHKDALKFVLDIWESKQGEWVSKPEWMLLEKANQLTSAILTQREKWERNNKPVEIRKVAEIRGSRFNIGKLRMDLIDPLAMEGLAAVLTKGAVKYSANNWRDGLPYTETVASMLRHVAKFMQGEDIDPETGLSHVDHIQCNAMFLSNMTKTRPDMDDRWKSKLPVVDTSSGST